MKKKRIVWAIIGYAALFLLLTYAGISQTGNTDPDDDDGAGKEVIDDFLDGIGDFFSDLFGGAQDAATTAKRLASLAVVTACIVAGCGAGVSSKATEKGKNKLWQKGRKGFYRL